MPYIALLLDIITYRRQSWRESIIDYCITPVTRHIINIYISLIAGLTLPMMMISRGLLSLIASYYDIDYAAPGQPIATGHRARHELYWHYY